VSRFNYTAKSADGKTVTGVLEGESEKGILEAIHKKGWLAVRIRTAPAARGTARRGRVGLSDLAMFARQLATLVDAGIPIVSGLDALSEQGENKRLAQALMRVRHDVEGGTGLTTAIGKEKEIFPPLFVSMVRAGESSGNLAEVLERVATYLEKSAAFQRKVVSACVYPAVVITMALGVTVILLIKVVPTFKEIFANFGAALPLPTQILLSVSDFAQNYFLLIFGAGLLLAVLLRKAIQTRPGRRLFDRFLLKLPVAGPLIRKVVIARFARTLSTLIRSGVPLLHSLDIVAESAGNRVVAEAVERTRDSIQQGESLTGPLTASRVFPPLILRMVGVGEQTGRLDQMLTKAAEFYEDQVETAVQGLTSAIEPIIIGVVGVLVGGIVLSIFLPLLRITQLIA